jgi:hypothetical protein
MRRKNFAWRTNARPQNTFVYIIWKRMQMETTYFRTFPSLKKCLHDHWIIERTCK